MPRRLISAAVAVVACLTFAVVAHAATKNGITPVSPLAGKKVAAGTAATFKMRAKGGGQVWVHVCKSAKKDKDGVICSEESIGQAKKSGKNYVYKAKYFDFPDFWLNTPGTYYWQTHRIQCVPGSTDCRKEGPVVRFRVG